MPPEVRGYEPEEQRRPPEEDPAKAAIRVQRELLARLPDDESRMTWIGDHAAKFRKLLDEDPSFRALVARGDLDGVEAALKGPLH